MIYDRVHLPQMKGHQLELHIAICYSSKSIVTIMKIIYWPFNVSLAIYILHIMGGKTLKRLLGNW